MKDNDNYSAINTLPLVLEQISDELSRTTGWEFTVLIAVVQPECLKQMEASWLLAHVVFNLRDLRDAL